MPRPIREEDAQLLRFGGGIHSRASEDQIDPRECTEGQNFRLDPGNGEFRRRLPFDLIGTTPNAAEIRGFVTLLKADGTVHMAVQSGSNVYEWDGAVTFTLIGTVSANAKIRGPKESNWLLDDKVIITDINLQDGIQEWDGSTFQETTMLQKDGSTSFGPFRAKYCVVDNERAIFFNVHDNGSNLPHLMVCSQRSAFEIISSGDRPSSSLSEEDPWFLPMPQFKPINGVAKAFGVIAISQNRGAFEKLTGTTAKDFELAKLYDGSGASGTEAVVSTTNDIIYGADGKIESLAATDRFGDVETDDLSFFIQPDVDEYSTWTIVYNPRVHKLYCFPSGESEVWVLHTDFIGAELSGWSKYVTKHGLAFQPTAIMVCRDPADGLEYVFMGDSTGNVYRMEGTGTEGDGGTHTIAASRTSFMYSAPVDAEAFNLEGWMNHRKQLANDIAITVLWSGEHVHDEVADRSLAALSYETVFGGEVYFGGNFYFGVAQENRLVRLKWAVPSASNQLQIKVEIDGYNDFAVSEIGFRYNVSA